MLGPWFPDLKLKKKNTEIKEKIVSQVYQIFILQPEVIEKKKKKRKQQQQQQKLASAVIIILKRCGCLQNILKDSFYVK